MRKKILKPIVSLLLSMPFSTCIHGYNSASVLELKQKYDYTCSNPTDIYEHVPVLRTLAMQCSSVVEIGTGTIVSTWGILQGLSESPFPSRSYLGIDKLYPPKGAMEYAKRLAEDSGVSFNFVQVDDMQIDMAPVDMLFIDSLHTYCHLTYELEKFSPKVGKYIAMHDTSEPWGDRDETCYLGNYEEYPAEYDRIKRGLWPAVEDFLSRHPEWTLVERRLNNHGFTILKRVEN